MSESQLTKRELRSIIDAVRADITRDTHEITVREAITEALADVNDRRFICGKDCLSEEDIERIRKTT